MGTESFSLTKANGVVYLGVSDMQLKIVIYYTTKQKKTFYFNLQECSRYNITQRATLIF